MESKSDAADLYQISLLIDQLRHDDSQMRINATKQLHRIGECAAQYPPRSLVPSLLTSLAAAQALGPERTRDELIPFLTGNGNLFDCQSPSQSRWTTRTMFFFLSLKISVNHQHLPPHLCADSLTLPRS
jgi:hypothetical protein